MFDISAVGAEVVIKTGSGEIRITHFSDEGTPFEAPDADFSNNQKNMNGDMISSRSPSVFPVSVTVIPNTEEDVQLTRFAQKNALQPHNNVGISSIEVLSIQLIVPALGGPGSDAADIKYTWTNGRLKSGPTGPSTSAEGRLAARTFTFEMESFDGSTGSSGYKV